MGNVKPVKMGKTEVYIARDVFELCDVLGLTPQDAVEIQFRQTLKHKIRDAVKAKKLTHEKVAKLAGTSRTKITAILNGNISGVSSDLLMRIVYSLGYQAKVTFTPIRSRRTNRKTTQFAA